MQRKIEISIGEYYHIYNRGVEKRSIFIGSSDLERFIKLLYLANGTKPFVFRSVGGLSLDVINVGEKKTAIIAYVLMPNHFHIIAREIKENGISEFMEKLSTAYAMYFNTVYKRVGPLFQGRFKAEHANSDEYLKYLFAYIHLNPIKLIEPQWKEEGIRNKKKAEQFLVTHRFSSYMDYTGVKRSEKAILTPEEAPKYFSGRRDFKDFVHDWLNYNNKTEGGARS